MACFFFHADDSAAIKLNQLIERIQIMATTLDDLLVKATAQTTLLASLNVFVDGLQQQIRDLNLKPADQTKIDALFAKLSENDQKIADAFIENLASGEPPVEPVNPI